MDNTSIQLFQGAAGAVGVSTNYVDDYFSARCYVGNNHPKRLINTRVDFSGDNAGGCTEFNPILYVEDNYYEFPASADWAFEGDFSIEFWAYITHNSENPAISWDTGAYQALFWDGSSNWKLEWPTGNNSINMGGTQPVGSWKHNLLTRSGSTIRFFQDGSLVATHTSSDTIGSNNKMYVGRKNNSGGVWLGYLSNLRIIKGSIPTDYQTTSTTIGANIYTVPTEKLTTISQGATANDVKLLGLHSTVESNAWTKASATPTMVGSKGGPRWSSNGPFTNTEDVSEGGMIWFKCRSDGGHPGYNFNTISGTGLALRTTQTGTPSTGTEFITNFNAQGITLNSSGNDGPVNTSGRTYVAWSFRKKKNFFDVVSWTGNTDTSQTISHGLGGTPGFIVCRCTSGGGTWFTYHRGVADASTNYMRMNTADAAATIGSSQSWNPTGSSFNAPGSLSLNDNGETYIAYLFAHDAGGFGADGEDTVVKCGSYTGTGSAGIVVDLGWEPQFLMIKDSSSTAGGWLMTDDTRGMDIGTIECLYANTTAAESSNNDKFSLTSTGFIVGPGDGDVNTNGNNYIYIAIRRTDSKVGRQPNHPVQVFGLRGVGTGGNNYTGSNRNEFKTDWFIEQYSLPNASGGTPWQMARPGGNYMYLSSNAAETDFGADILDSWFGYQYGNRGTEYGSYMWKRWKGFDVVKWVGSNTVPTMVTHHMGSTPEMIWAKKRSSGNWFAWHKDLDSGGFGKYLKINGQDAVASSGALFHSATDTQIGFNGSSDININGQSVLTMTFASMTGVSKVGSYTGSSAVKSLDFGFTPKWLMIKRTDSTGDWMLWDTRRGIVAGGADWGEQIFTHEGSSAVNQSFTAPSGVSRVSAVFVGGGGGGRAYSGSNGSSTAAYFDNSFYMQATYGYAGTSGASRAVGGAYGFASTGALSGGTYGGGGGGDGGYGQGNSSGGGGGAAGYTGSGGQGANLSGAGQAGAGGGGGGGYGGGGHGNPGGGGGSVGLMGEGANGGSTQGGSGGANGTTSRPPTGTVGAGGFGYYGSGGGGGAGLAWANNIPVQAGQTYTITLGSGGQQWDNQNTWLRTGGNGAARIIWGAGRTFPSTNTGDNKEQALHLNNGSYDNFNFMATTSTGVDLVAGQALINVNGGSYIYYAHA